MNDYLNELTTQIEQALTQGINPQHGVLEAAIHYALCVKGKRLRPLLFLTLLEAYGKNPADYLDIACSIEYIHTYSLIHDDLPAMDNDDFRRGMPTVHKQFNEAIALLAGDTLLTYAFERISRAPVPADKIVHILYLLTTGIGKDGMAGGQALDLEFTGKQEQIFTIHRLKTAELIKASLLAAASLLNLSEKETTMIADLGLSIGIAFQMADDLLDITGNEKEVGKKLKKDQHNQSPNCVLFYGETTIRNKINDAYSHAMSILNDLPITFPPFLSLMEKMVYRSK